MSRACIRVPGLSGLLGWTRGCGCHEHKGVMVSFSVDLLCGWFVRQLALECASVLAGLVQCFGLELSLVTHSGTYIRPNAASLRVEHFTKAASWTSSTPKQTYVPTTPRSTKESNPNFS
jgi:hypothetical protein